MMRVLVFTSSPTIRTRFAAIERSKMFEILFVEPDRMKKTIEEYPDTEIVYIDAGSGPKDLKRLIRELTDSGALRVGILDLKNEIDDPAGLFFEGAVDYLGKPMLSSEVASRRLKKAFESSLPGTKAETAPKKGRKKTRRKDGAGTAAGGAASKTGTKNKRRTKKKRRYESLSGSTWNGVQNGREYTFVLLYIEIDLTEEWRTKSGKTHLDEVVSLFHKHVDRVISPLDGKVWMWTHTGGVVLFPFDGKTCPAIRTCFKLVLDSTIISAEEYPYKTQITYSMAIHIGNTVYRGRGDTGTIVSETVNFIFHLGDKFLKRGNFFVTDAAAPFIPEGLVDCFGDAGTFENIDVLRMRLPKRR